MMGPAILARAGLRFAAKVHGSALEYTVKPNPERFLPYAREGTRRGGRCLVGSEHTASEPVRGDRRPRAAGEDAARPAGGGHRPVSRRWRGEAPDGGLAGDPRGSSAGDAWEATTPAGAAAALARFAEARRAARVLFVGKLIVSKGIDLLLAAWPLVVAENPGARLLVVGFGDMTRETAGRSGPRSSPGDLETAADDRREGRGLEGGEDAPLACSRLPRRPARRLRGGRPRSRRQCRPVAGRLEHDEVGEVVPACDALVFPSTFPEAFGMVAAEPAAAAGPAGVGEPLRDAAEVSQRPRRGDRRRSGAALVSASTSTTDASIGDGSPPPQRLAGDGSGNPPRPGPGLRETVARAVELERGCGPRGR